MEEFFRPDAQLVHHPLWDMDISSAPLLADITVNGRAIKAVAQPSKQGFLYVFDRVTGKPVWPIEERKVERSPATRTRRPRGCTEQVTANRTR